MITVITWIVISLYSAGIPHQLELIFNIFSVISSCIHKGNGEPVFVNSGYELNNNYIIFILKTSAADKLAKSPNTVVFTVNNLLFWHNVSNLPLNCDTKCLPHLVPLAFHPKFSVGRLRMKRCQSCRLFCLFSLSPEPCTHPNNSLSSRIDGFSLCARVVITSGRAFFTCGAEIRGRDPFQTHAEKATEAVHSV